MSTQGEPDAPEPEAPEPDPTPEPEPTPEPDTGEADKWKAMARKHEAEAKKATKDLEAERKKHLSEADKALEDAKQQARAEAKTEFGSKLAAAEIKAALAGVIPDAKARAEVVDDLNLAKFLTEDGEVNDDAIGVLTKKYSQLAKSTTSGSADGGARDRDDKPKRSTSLSAAVDSALSAK